MPFLIKVAFPRAVLGCVLYAVSSAAGAADAVEGLSLSAQPDLSIQPLMAEMPAVPFPDHSASAVRAAVDAEGEESGGGYLWDGPPASSPDW
jgi:hypothetical protein